MAISDSPQVKALAKKGVPWAVKAVEKGWQSLSKAQKTQAMAAIGNKPQVVVQNGLNVTRVSAPIAKAMRTTISEPRISTAGKTQTVTHCELLGNVLRNTSDDLLISEKVLNPSRVGTFNQLSITASLYEMYRFSALKIRYSPLCPTTTGGKVAIAIDRDSSDSPPTDKASLYNYEGIVSTSPWDSLLITVPTDNVKRYVADNTSSDPKLIDFGKVLVCSYGNEESAPAILGEVFIEYTCVFYNRQGTSPVTQSGSLTQSTGPRYATWSSRPSTTEGNVDWYLTFDGVGTFLMAFYLTVAPVYDVQNVDCARFNRQGSTSGGDAAILVTVLASEPGQQVRFGFAGTSIPDSTFWVGRV